MKNFFYKYKCRYRHKVRKIVGIVLGIIGFLIIINIISIEALLFLVSVILIIMGALLLKLK